MTAWPKVERTMSDIAHRADARNRVDDDFIDRDRLVLSHDRLIQKIVRQNQRSGKVPWSDDAFDDAVSSGNIAFLEAYPRYDPAAGHPVRTFAWKPVDGEVKRFGRENASIIKTPRGEDHLNVDSLSGPAFKGESDDGDTELVSSLSDSAPSAEKNILREE